MAKTKISEYDASAGNNTDVNNVNINEGCAPSGINNAIREVMAALKRFETGADGDSLTVGGSLVVSGSATLGDASGDSVTINASTVSTPNGLNFDSDTLVIDATNNRVGIGTSSPAALLHIASSTGDTLLEVESTFAGGDSRLGLIANSAGVSQIRFGDEASDNVGFLTYDHTDNSMAFRTNSAERMRITSAGEVLVGGTTEIISATGLTIQRTDTNAILSLYRNDTSISSGNTLGSIRFYGNDTTSNTPTQLASIEAVASGDHAAGDNPTDLVFATTADGSATVAEAVRIKDGGGLQISRTGVTVPATGDGNVFSGTYTPTLTNTTNVASSSTGVCQYMRVGNVVTVSGQVDIDPTATGDTILGVSLPVASNLSAQITCAGTFISLSGATFQGGSIYGDSTNDRATFRYAASSAAAFDFQFNFTYRVI